jgi:hypothetical protein
MTSGVYTRKNKHLPVGKFPQEIRSAAELGYVGYAKFIWLACPECHEYRWMQHTKAKKTPEKLCRKCAQNHRPLGADSPAWKGGRHLTHQGYVQSFVQRDSQFRSMAKRDGYCLEHRLVMARSLQRVLTRREVVHHKDGNRQNNTLSNLELMSDMQAHMVKRHDPALIARLEAKIKRLEAELVQLKRTL